MNFLNKKKGIRRIFAFAVCLAMMFTVMCTGAFAAFDVSLNEPVITLDDSGENYEFFVTADGFDTTANAVVAAYTDEGECVEKSVKPMDADGVTLTLTTDTKGLDYKVMLLGENLKPLCPAYIGNVEISSKSLKILSDDLVSYGNGILEYYVDAANSNKTKEIKLTNYIPVEYNKGADTKVMEDFLYEDDVELVFIENTGDDVFDKIVATKYVYDIVTYVDAARERLSLKNSSTIAFDFEDEDTTTIFEDDKGNAIGFEDIKENDVVAVVADANVPARYDKYIKVIKLVNGVINGMIEETYTVNGEEYVVINGKTYSMAIADNLKTGTEGIFYIGITGKVVHFEGKRENYAYILEGAIANGVFTNDQWQLKMLTEDGVKTFDIRKNSYNAIEAYINTNFVGTSGYYKFIFDEANDGSTMNGKLNPARLVTYELDGNGDIKELTPVTGISTFNKANDEYNADSQRIGNQIIEDDVVIFNVTGRYAKDAKVTDIAYLVDEASYTGFVGKNNDDENVVMVIIDEEQTFSTEEGFAVVSHISTMLNDNGDKVLKVSYVQGDKEGYLIIDDDTECINARWTDLSVGSAFVYIADADGVAREYAVIAEYIGGHGSEWLTLSEEADGYIEERLFGEGTEFVLGYIANTRRSSVSKGELITVGDEQFLIDSDTKFYLFDNSRRYGSVVTTPDFMIENMDYFDEYENTGTIVLLGINNGKTNVVYALNRRVDVTTGEAVKTEPRISSGDGKTITIFTSALANPGFDGRVAEYYTDAPKYTINGLEKLTLNRNVTFTLNNRVIVSNEALGICDITDYVYDGILTFTDSDSDGYYDIVKAEQYFTDFVADADEDTITLKSSGREFAFDFESDDVTAVFEDSDGNEISFGDISNGDLIAIATDGDDNKNYDKYIKIVKLTDSVVTGKVEETYTVNEEEYVVINGKTYSKAIADNLEAGTEGIFYIGITGKVVHFEGKLENYAYILEGAIANGVFTNDRWQLKMLTEDGVQIFDIRENSYYSIVRYIENNFEDAWTGRFLFEGANDRDNPARLVTYKIDGNGYLKEIASVSDVDVFDKGVDVYNADLHSIGKHHIEEDVCIFNVSAWSAEDAYTTDISYLEDEASYTGFVGKNNDGENEVMVIIDEERSFSEEAGFAVATDVTRATDDNGDAILKVSYVQGEDKGTVILNDDSFSIGLEEQVDKGDAFIFVADNNCVVNEYYVLAKNEEYRFVFTDSEYDMFLPNVEFVLGYILNDRRNSVSNGELITVGGEQILITEETQTYLLENSRDKVSVIKTNDLFVENVDYFDEESNTATIVLVSIYNDMANAVYALNQRVDITTGDPVETPSRVSVGDGEAVTISLDELANSNSEGRVVEYYTDAPEYTLGSIERLTLNESATLIVNNVRTLSKTQISPYMITDYVFGGYMTFNDTDTDGYYDEIDAKEYVYDIVDYVDTARSKIVLKNNGAITLYMDDSNIDIILKDDSSNPLGVEDFEEGDFVAVVSDASRPSRYDEYIEIVKFTDSAVYGKIDEVSTNGDNCFAVINGKKYASDVDGLVAGEKGVFYLDFKGRIVCFEGEGNSNYAYILEGAIANGAFTNDQWQLKMLTEDGVKTFGIGKNYYAEIANYIEDNFVGSYYKFIFDEANDGSTMNGKLNPARLVTYKLDGNGDIKELNPVADINTFNKFEDEYNADIQRIAKQFIEDDVVIFDVTGRYAKDAQVTDISYLVDETCYTGFVGKNANGENDVMVITDVESVFTEDTGFAIVTKISTAKNDDGEEVTKINYVQNEEEGVITIDDDSELINADRSLTLKLGTAFLFVADGAGLVSEYVVIATVDANDKFVLTTEAINAGVTADVLGDNTEIVTGFILNEKYESTSKGELITVVGTDIFLIRDTTYKYTYNASGRNVVIDVGDFMADTDYKAQDDPHSDTWYASPVLLRLVGGVVADVYGTTARIEQ